MRRCFIEVHDRIEHIKIWISRLKAVHVFSQTFNRIFSIGSADTCIIFRANLHQVPVEIFLFICTRDDTRIRFTIEQMLKVVADFPIISFLTDIVSFYCTTEKLMISFAQILTDKNDIVRSA